MGHRADSPRPGAGGGQPVRIRRVSSSCRTFLSGRTLRCYFAAATIAAVASLETLLNLEAVDKLDPEQRTSPPNRELLAQGVGNVASGLVGGLPVTSVIIRSFR